MGRYRGLCVLFLMTVLSASSCAYRGFTGTGLGEAGGNVRELEFFSFAPIESFALDVPRGPCTTNDYCSSLDDYEHFNQTYKSLSQRGALAPVGIRLVGNGQQICTNSDNSQDCTNVSSCEANSCVEIRNAVQQESDVFIALEALPANFVLGQTNALFVSPEEYSASLAQLPGKTTIMTIGTQETCGSSRFFCVVVPDSWKALPDNATFAVGSLAAKVLSLWRDSIGDHQTLLSVLSQCRNDTTFIIDVGCFLSDDKTHLSLTTFSQIAPDLSEYEKPKETYEKKRRSWVENRYCITFISWCGGTTDLDADEDQYKNEAINAYTEMISSYRKQGPRKESLRVGVFSQEALSDAEKEQLEKQTLNATLNEERDRITIDYIVCSDDTCDALNPTSLDSSSTYDIVILGQSNWLSKVGFTEESSANLRSDIAIIPHWFDADILPHDLSAIKRHVVQMSPFCAPSEEFYCFDKNITIYNDNFAQQERYGATTERQIVLSTLLGITLAQWGHFHRYYDVSYSLGLLAEDCRWEWQCFEEVFQDLRPNTETVDRYAPAIEPSPVFGNRRINQCIHLLFSLCGSYGDGSGGDYYTSLLQLFVAKAQLEDEEARDAYKAFLYYKNSDDVKNLPNVLPSSLNVCLDNAENCREKSIIVGNLCSDCTPLGEIDQTQIIYISQFLEAEKLAVTTNADDENSIYGIYSPIVVIRINNETERDAYQEQDMAITQYDGTIFVTETEAFCDDLTSCFIVPSMKNVYNNPVDGASFLLSAVAYLSSASSYSGAGELFVQDLFLQCRDSDTKQLRLEGCLQLSPVTITIGNKSAPRSSTTIGGKDADLFVLNKNSLCPSRSTLCDGLFVKKEDLSIKGSTLFERYLRQKKLETLENLLRQRTKLTNQRAGETLEDLFFLKIKIGFFFSESDNASITQNLMDIFGEDACLTDDCPSNEEISSTNIPIFQVESCGTISCSAFTPDVLILASSTVYTDDSPSPQVALLLSHVAIQGAPEENVLLAINDGEDCPMVGRCLVVPSTFVSYDENYAILQVNQSLAEITRLGILAKISSSVFWLWPSMVPSQVGTLLLGCGSEDGNDGNIPILSLGCFDTTSDSITLESIKTILGATGRDELEDNYVPVAGGCLISLCPGVAIWSGEVPSTRRETLLPSSILGYDTFLEIYQNAYKSGELEQKNLVLVASTDNMSDTTKAWFNNLPEALKHMFHTQQAEDWICSSETCSPDTPIVLKTYGCESEGECYQTPSAGVLVVYDVTALPKTLPSNTLLILGSIGHERTQDNLVSRAQAYTQSALVSNAMENVLWAVDVTPNLLSETSLPEAVCPLDRGLYRSPHCVSLPAYLRHYAEGDAEIQDVYATSAAILGVIAVQVRSLFPALSTPRLKDALTLCAQGQGQRFSLACLLEGRTMTIAQCLSDDPNEICSPARYQVTASRVDVPFYQGIQKAELCYGYNSLCSGIRLFKYGQPSLGISGYETFLYNIKHNNEIMASRKSVSVGMLLPSPQNEKTLRQRQEEARTSMIIMASVAGQTNCANNIHETNVENLGAPSCADNFVKPRLITCVLCAVSREIRILHIPDLDGETLLTIARQYPNALLISAAHSDAPDATALPRLLQAGTWQQQGEERLITQSCSPRKECLIVPETFYGFDRKYQRLLITKKDASTEILAGIAALFATLFPQRSAQEIISVMLSCAQSDPQGSILSLSCFAMKSPESTNNDSQTDTSQTPAQSSQSLSLPPLPSAGVLHSLGDAPGSLLWRSTMASQQSRNREDTSLLRLFSWMTLFTGVTPVQEKDIDTQEGLAFYSGGDFRLPLARAFSLEGRALSIVAVRHLRNISTPGSHAVVTLDMGVSLAITKTLTTTFAPVEMSLQGACTSGSMGIISALWSLNPRPSCRASMGMRIVF